MSPRHNSSARNTRSSSIATRKSYRLHGRSQHGKYWYPIFFERRFSGDDPLVEQCRRIFVGEVEGNENSRNDNPQGGGHSDEIYGEEEKTTEDNIITDDAMTTAGVTISNTNTATSLQRYQGKEIKLLFDKQLSHMFLSDWDGSITSWEAKVVRNFFSREDNNNAFVKADDAAWAWLDDREYCTGNRRNHVSRMGAIDLCAALRQEVIPTIALNVTH